MDAALNTATAAQKHYTFAAVQMISPLCYRFDPKEESQFGHWRCVHCNHRFYGARLGSLHEDTCTMKDSWPVCEFVFGPKQVAEVKAVAQRKGDDDAPLARYHPLTLRILREQFPQLLS